MRTLAFALWLFLLAACGQGFPPASYVDRLRILAVRAEPPEIGRDGELSEESELSTLVADPAALADPEREVTLLYLSCTPDPRRTAPSRCTALSTLQSPESLAALAPSSCGSGAGIGGGGESATPFESILLLGAESCQHTEGCRPLSLPLPGGALDLPPPRYRIPSTLNLDELPVGDARRVKGIQAVITVLAVQTTAEELLEGVDTGLRACEFADALLANFLRLYGERESGMAIKRVQIRGPDQTDGPNRNPRIDGLVAGGKALSLPPQAPVAFRKGSSSLLEATLPERDPHTGQPLTTEELFQVYTRLGASGQEIRVEQEEWVYSWFSTAGRFEKRRTRGADRPVRWEAPTGRGEDTDAIPPSGRVFFYTVVRDGRGGVDWVQREALVTD